MSFRIIKTWVVFIGLSIEQMSVESTAFGAVEGAKMQSPGLTLGVLLQPPCLPGTVRKVCGPPSNQGTCDH